MLATRQCLVPEEKRKCSNNGPRQSGEEKKRGSGEVLVPTKTWPDTRSLLLGKERDSVKRLKGKGVRCFFSIPMRREKKERHHPQPAAHRGEKGRRFTDPYFNELITGGRIFATIHFS